MLPCSLRSRPTPPAQTLLPLAPARPGAPARVESRGSLLSGVPTLAARRRRPSRGHCRTVGAALMCSCVGGGQPTTYILWTFRPRLHRWGLFFEGSTEPKRRGARWNRERGGDWVLWADWPRPPLQSLPLLLGNIGQTTVHPCFAPGMVRTFDPGLLTLLTLLQSADLPIASGVAKDIPKMTPELPCAGSTLAFLDRSVTAATLAPTGCRPALGFQPQASGRAPPLGRQPSGLCLRPMPGSRR
jgi:hypothetical protein